MPKAPMLGVYSACSLSSAAFQAPAIVPQRSAAAVRMGVDDMIGKYSLAKTVYDPLDLASKYDVNWLREAELKHGRICMLAFAGWITVDAGITFPGPAFEGIKALEAHDAMVENGYMWTLLALVGGCELLHAQKVWPLLDTDWEGREPGNYGWLTGLDSPARREAELKNGRAAMIAFSGLVTQCALGHPAPYW